ncbi:lipopolysaccharide assembly LapA domain-containing protein [Mesobacillus subterraneus]|uniref:LapA family protein n=1 Tax=Mesobacillus subterraneus TaxID=285983 RepID=UPI001CFE86BD|nr:lipopolysaccharide assembly protein LapA domain-containing protein [Mesobacillus subterraneus]
MKFQWTLLLGLAFALIVAVFAVINVDSVTVNYLFGESEWPLILVILGSVLMGGIIVGSVGLFRMFVLQREVKSLRKKNKTLEEQLAQKETAQEDSAQHQIEDIH